MLATPLLMSPIFLILRDVWNRKLRVAEANSHPPPYITVQTIKDPDPGSPKNYGSNGSGSW